LYVVSRTPGRNPFNQVTSKKYKPNRKNLDPPGEVVIPLIRSQVKNLTMESIFLKNFIGRNPFNQVTSKKFEADGFDIIDDPES